MAAGSVGANITPPRAKVLCIDDEFTVLESLERILRTRFDVDKASSARDAEDALKYGGPYAVVISDLRLADTDGIQLLARFREESPETVRLLITGFADMDSAIAAINDGRIFALIRKPCRADALLERVSDAAHHHQLLTAERTIVEQTVRGAIKAMNDLVAARVPAAAARGTRLARYAVAVATAMGVSSTDIELAALASYIGCMAIDFDLAERIVRGGTVSSAEQEIADRLPEVAATLLAPIPRLERVREMLGQQRSPFVSKVGLMEAQPEQEIPVGARILRVVTDFDGLHLQGVSVPQAIVRLRSTNGIYDPAVLDALTTVGATLTGDSPRFDRTPRDVRRVAS
jgi:response regulator RpfG family c-di-GMP phosphodiesterase